MKSLLPTISLALCLATAGATAQSSDDGLRGERVGWARLQTPSPNWFRHSSGDPVLMRFLRNNTSLNIDPAWYTASVESLDEMCKYPLLFSQGIFVVTDPQGRSNIAEYIRRGGFLLVDSCINTDITPDPDIFLARHIACLAAILPEARVVALPPDHAIYHAYFQIPGGRPPHTYMSNVFNPQWYKHGLYGIMIGSRMAGIISLSGLQCGWDRMIAPPNHDVACMRMLVNIYIYAMMQGGS
jgi:hypothetical protein